MKTSIVIAESNISFGTSGARGLVVDFTPEVSMAFAYAFSAVVRDTAHVDTMALGIDNRPSSYAIAMACASALISSGIKPIFYGVIPTPALAAKAKSDCIPAIMVTGSHIPFDRNGLKFYRPEGEITKEDEKNIINKSIDFTSSKTLPDLTVDTAAVNYYIERYLHLFDEPIFKGLRIGIYEHSSAGRNIYYKIFSSLGGEVIRLGRSDEFVPIDTEAVSDDDKKKAIIWSKQYQLDVVFSTDGDGDRPLVADEHGNWIRGDILGLLCSQELGINAVAVPVSCNTSISQSGFFNEVMLTKIGSPYVIEAFSSLASRHAKIAGFEPNGGYLLGTDLLYHGKELSALPTRDAVLPVIMLLAATRNATISQLISKLPQRFTYSDRLQNFATEISALIVKNAIKDPSVFLKLAGLSEFKVVSVDHTDGVRLFLDNNSVVHIRPSGNAPEFRCYAEAESEEYAKFLVQLVLENVNKLK